MGTSQHREVERKYDVDSGTVLPDLVGVDGVASASQQVVHDLEATYFDTATLDLLHHKVTLRRRTGGDDAGWHLKLPESAEARIEVRMPLGRHAAPDTLPPDELVDPVRAIVRDRPLQAVARVSTHRLERTLLDADGREMAQLSDDRVTAERLIAQREPALLGTVTEARTVPATEPATVSAAATPVEPPTDLATPTVSEPLDETPFAPTAEPLAEPFAEHTAEPFVEPTAEPFVEPLGEPLSEPLTESVTEPLTATVQSAATMEWREVEVELVDGSEDLIERIDAVLTAAGCSRATVGSKVARALGETAYRVGRIGAGRPTPPTSRKAARKGSARDLLLAHLAEHVGELQEHDRGVRAGEPGSVHKMRIAARRIRSALVTYRKLLAPGSVEPLRNDLKWLGQSLGRARDADVLRDHLDEVLSAEPPELVLGPVATRIDDTLGAQHQMGVEEALEALRSERYYRLLDSLDDLITWSAWTLMAEERAGRVVPKLLRRDAKRLERAVSEIDEATDEEATDPQAHDVALHEARKKAKRYRYAAESAIPAYGKPAKRLARRAKQVQSTLGEHQDAVVARAALRELGVQAHLSDENGFTYGRLHALEQQRADRAEAEFEKAWRRLPRRRLRRILKG
ncbi:CHAD domain-containing protein [Monashia sp. NPDC004114]